MIWEAALPGPRIVHIRHRSLRKTIGQWEEENDAIWPAFDGEIVPRPKQHTVEQVYISDRQGSGTRHVSARNYVRDELYYSGIDLAASMDYQKAHLQGLTCDFSTPQNLLACREVYEVVARHYTRAFACPLSIPQIYFNFNLDILYLRYDTFTGNYKQTTSNWADIVIMLQNLDAGFGIEGTDDPRKVRRLAILLDHNEAELLREYRVIRRLLWIFPSLEKLYLVMNHLVYGSEDDMQPTDSSSMALIEPIDVDEAVQTWHTYDPTCETDRDSVRLPVIHGFDEDCAEYYVDAYELKQWNQEDHEAGKDWAIPELEFKFMIHESSKRWLDASRQLCEARIKRNLLDRHFKELEEKKIMLSQQT